jgi:hypothetical protein
MQEDAKKKFFIIVSEVIPASCISYLNKEYAKF